MWAKSVQQVRLSSSGDGSSRGEDAARRFWGCDRGDLTSSELGWRKGLRGVSRSITKTPFGALSPNSWSFPSLWGWTAVTAGVGRPGHPDCVQLASRPRQPRALARPAHSLLGRAPHRGPGLRADRHLPALPRRGPRLAGRRLRAARPGPRSGLRHGSPTHGRPHRALRSGRLEPWLRCPAPREVRTALPGASLGPPPRPLTPNEGAWQEAKRPDDGYACAEGPEPRSA